MAKKVKKQTNRAPRSQPTKEELLDKLGFKKKKVNDELAAVGEGIAPISSDISLLEQDVEQEAKAREALEEIQQLIETLQEKILEHGESTENYEKLSIGIEEQQQKLGQKREELNEGEAELHRQRVKLDEAMSLLNEQRANIAARQKELDLQAKNQILQEEKLAAQKDEAEAGFIREYKASVERKRAELAKLQREHNEAISEQSARLNKLDADLLERERDLTEREASAKAGFISKQKEVLKDFASKKLQVESELSALNDRLSKSQDTLTLHKKRQEVQRRSEVEWKESVRIDLDSQYRTEIGSLEAQLSQERKNREQDRLNIADLQKELINFRDLQHSLESANIENIQEELNKLRQQNKELKTRLWTSDEDIEEKCELLEERCNEQRDEITSLRQELAETQTKLHKHNLSVGARHHLEQQKRILELQHSNLDSQVNALKSQLNDLVKRQEGNKVFPALSGMDQRYKRKASNLQPISDLRVFAEQLRLGMASLPNAPLYYREEDVRVFLAGLSMSNLHILQGMSGTGKTSLAKAFARVVGGHCTDIAVQAGWRDKDDLLGHYNAFEKRFYESEALQALYRAQLPAYEDRINIILLDEMNLSRPEQYFADFNSALEKDPADKDRNIVLLEVGQADAPNKLIEGRKIFVPGNVWFIGTANHDETTNEFADKTYDRAHVMELSRNDEKFNCASYDGDVTYSFSSLRNSFENAYSKHRKAVDNILSGLNESKLKSVLEDDFTVSWGNRLERHAQRFIPVLKEAGGSIEEGVDHLLATKLFRTGKATGRYNINTAVLDKVSEAVNDTWKALKLKGQPTRTINCIQKDRRSKELNK